MTESRNFRPDEKQVLYLWELLFTHGGSALNKDMTLKDACTGDRRTRLVRAGLIEVEREGRTFRVSLLDAGWDWAATNLDAPFWAQTKLAAPVLAGVLARLRDGLSAHDLVLADLFPCPEAPLSSSTARPEDLHDRIRDVCLAVGGGAGRVRIRIAELRTRLADVPRAELDAALRALEAGGALRLFPLDDPRSIDETDRHAAIGSGDHARHLVYLT